MKGPPGKSREDLRSYIESSSTPEPNSGCWLWNLSLNQRGYGMGKSRKTHGNRNILAHRLSFEVFKGPIGSLFVLHKCDTPACVNPDHLTVGTHADNMRQMAERNRGSKVRSMSRHADATYAHKRKDCDRWVAQSSIKGVRKHLGLFKTKEEAQKAVINFMSENDHKYKTKKFMRNSVYYCQMSAGNIHRVEFATSAGEAIHQALFVHRGRTVTACWQGPSVQHPGYSPGRINYDVPAHSPIPHDAVKPTNRKAKDNTEVMAFMEETA